MYICILYSPVETIHASVLLGEERSLQNGLIFFIGPSHTGNLLSCILLFKSRYYGYCYVLYLSLPETEKYAHVTFFFNGGVEKQFEGETRFMVPSPKVATYDLKPEMNAEGVGQEVKL